MRGIGLGKVLVAAAGVAALWTQGAPGADAASSMQVVYAGGEFGSGLEYFAVQSGRAAGFETAPLGDIRFLARGSSFTLNLDDKVPVGTMPVEARIGNRFQSVCVAPNVPVVFSGARPGDQIVVWIDGSTYAPWSGCTRGATTGTATVTF